jgi:hypothetical protein
MKNVDLYGRVPDEAKASSTVMSKWIDANRSAKPGKGHRKTGERSSKPPAAKAAESPKRARKPKATTALADVTPPLACKHQNSTANTPLQIPYGNKEVAQKLGARYEKGWAQVDTAQDASYFGTWANPVRLMIFSYCEGDTTLREAGSPEEFAAKLREIDAWNRAHGYGPARIDPGFDPGFDPAMKAAFEGWDW